MGHPAHARGTSYSRRDGYVRRNPEQSVLYKVVQAEWPALRERAEEQGGLPKFVVRGLLAKLGLAPQPPPAPRPPLPGQLILPFGK